MNDAESRPCSLVFSKDNGKHCMCWERGISCCWCEDYEIGKVACE